MGNESCCLAPAPNDATRRRILEVAAAAFVAHGFHLTTMDLVARAAQCSKKTVYKLFSSKEELFRELLNGMRSAVGELPVDATLPPAEALGRFLRGLAALLLDDRFIGLMRIAVTEAGNARSALPAPSQGRLQLEDYLEALDRGGGYDFGPAPEAARGSRRAAPEAVGCDTPSDKARPARAPA